MKQLFLSLALLFSTLNVFAADWRTAWESPATHDRVLVDVASIKHAGSQVDYWENTLLGIPGTLQTGKSFHAVEYHVIGHCKSNETAISQMIYLDDKGTPLSSVQVPKKRLKFFAVTESTAASATLSFVCGFKK